MVLGRPEPPLRMPPSLLHRMRNDESAQWLRRYRSRVELSTELHIARWNT